MDLAVLHELAAQQAAARAAGAEFASRLRGEFAERLVWVRLYGSLARGDWLGADESDVDVAIVIREKSNADIDRIIHLASDQLLRSGYVFSPRIFTPEEFAELERRELRLPRDILSEGKLL
jgi:predicted nucleotidyltransferase